MQHLCRILQSYTYTKLILSNFILFFYIGYNTWHKILNGETQDKTKNKFRERDGQTREKQEKEWCWCTKNDLKLNQV